MCTGWTWEYIDDNMTIPRLQAMSDYWQEHPPLHQLVATFLGVKSKAPKEQDNASLLELVGGGGFSSEKPEWLKTE